MPDNVTLKADSDLATSARLTHLVSIATLTDVESSSKRIVPGLGHLLAAWFYEPEATEVTDEIRTRGGYDSMRGPRKVVLLIPKPAV